MPHTARALYPEPPEANGFHSSKQDWCPIDTIGLHGAAELQEAEKLESFSHSKLRLRDTHTISEQAHRVRKLASVDMSSKHVLLMTVCITSYALLCSYALLSELRTDDSSQGVHVAS